MCPQSLRFRNHNSGLAHRTMVKRLATSPHDPLGITDSACKNQLVMVNVQYGPFNPYIPIRSTTIGKSRVAIDPIAMHTFWRSNSDIASATSIGYPRMSASGESSTTMHRLLHASGSHPILTPYDPNIGYPRMSASGESSTTMHRLLHASGSHPIPTPYDPNETLHDRRLTLTRLPTHLGSLGGGLGEVPMHSTGCVLGKWVYLVTLAISLFDLQDVCIAIGSLATLDLPMVVDLIGIYVLKGPYCTLTTTNWFLQELSAIPRGSWGDVARRFTMIRWARLQSIQLTHNPSLHTSHSAAPPLPQPHATGRRLAPPRAAAVCRHLRDRTCFDHRDEEFPSVLNSSVILVQADEGVLIPVVDLIRRIYRRLQFKSQISL
ncbi:hypothetical protein F511_06447 [Dorcoceras hygrometricum]|uniref:Uncharacterized protein n=1 Tax=Dorcoceras hygrometricum TaxID=472368 RepID=A0A2Z7B113_9LAMI|nr:hypothetical protein F511_06447 [Dorcoceras hygrometricum]